MVRRWLAVLVLLPLLLGSASGSAYGATYQTPNFVVTAPSDALAQQVASAAEKARQEWSVRWLGRELPRWQRQCPVKVTVTQSSGGGATTFGFGQGEPSMHMSVEGRPEKILSSVIPHEVTHTILATCFRGPVPRWADEGAAVCSEDQEELEKNNKMCREVLNTGRSIPLKRLFAMREYPQDPLPLYAQGFSLTHYLIQAGGRQRFLAFLQQAQQRGWDQAVNSCYGLQGVDALEQQWLSHLKATKGQSVASGTSPGTNPVPQPQSPPGTPGSQEQGLVAALSRIEGKLNVLAGVKEDVEMLKERMNRAEMDIAQLKGGSLPSLPKTPPYPHVPSSTAPSQPQPLALTPAPTIPQGTISDIPGWNQPRVNPARPPGGFAVPTMAPAGPFCAPGGY